MLKNKDGYKILEKGWEIIKVKTVKDELAHHCDGPITAFVLICRAINHANETNKDIVAEALYELLVEYGFMKDNDEQ